MNLVIERFSHSDAGVYTCKATQIVNGQEKKIEQSLTVRVKEQTGSILHFITKNKIAVSSSTIH